jgi:hypothetical protein
MASTPIKSVPIPENTTIDITEWYPSFSDIFNDEELWKNLMNFFDKIPLFGDTLKWLIANLLDIKLETKEWLVALKDEVWKRTEYVTMLSDDDSGSISWLWKLSERFESLWKPYAINFNDGWSSSFWSYQLRGWQLEKFAQENGIAWYRKWVLSNWHSFTKNWISKINSLWIIKFKKLEHDFIGKTHYAPQIVKISRDSWINANNFSPAIKDVIWSVSVQHWPNSNLVVKSLSKLWKLYFPLTAIDEKRIINQIYSDRINKYSFLRKRYIQERKLALSSIA